jgi:HD-GYP domain-containing protein (c-di-GMP phosphodiesterase class II)
MPAAGETIGKGLPKGVCFQLMDTVMTFAFIIMAVLFLISTVLLWRKQVKINKITKLYHIGAKITSNIKIKSLMNEIMEITKEALKAEASTLYLIDEENQELWFEIALGEKGSLLKEIRLKLGEGIAGWVAKEGVTLNLEDANKDSRFMSSIGKKIDFKQKAMLTVPVKYKGKTIGVLQVINRKGSLSFTKGDQEFLEGMSNQVAIALENARLYKDLKDLFTDSIMSLAEAIDAKDPYTNGHSRRVTEYSVAIGKEMKLDEESLEKLEYMAILHDVGKIGIKDSILNKQAQLDDDEYAIMKTHTLVGSKILDSMKSLKTLSFGAKYHHEKYDGTGYNSGLKGDEIPFEARIIAIADTYDAMTTDRPYRKGLDHIIALNEINRFAGTQFDPELVKYFNLVMERDKNNNAE